VYRISTYIFFAATAFCTAEDGNGIQYVLHMASSSWHGASQLKQGN